MALETRIITAGEQIAKIARRLPELGYRFRSPSEVFPGPEPGTENAIDRIEREAGELPLALKIFWRLVGSVDFTAHYITSWPVEYPWPGCDYPDPLVVYPPSAAVAEWDAFLGDREERMRCDLPYVVPIAPDDAHKDNVSGGMWYNLTVPAIADDPPLNDERHQTTFVSYLELAVRWGGFPGLERCPKHRWPLRQLVDTPSHNAAEPVTPSNAMPDRGYTLIDFTPPPGLWPDQDRVVRFMEHVRTNFHRIVQGLPAECELDLLASGHAHNPGLVPLLALRTSDSSLDDLPNIDRMTAQVSDWCSALPPHEVDRIAATTVAPTWEELVQIAVHPPR